MSIFSSIGHGISNVAHDIFGGGNGNKPSSTTTTTTFALQKLQGGNQQPGSIVAPQNAFNIAQLTNGTLVKKTVPVAPTVTQTTTVDPSVIADQQAWKAAHPSTLSKIGHIGAGVVKTVAEPFVNTGEDVSNAIGNAEIGIGHKFGIRPDLKTQTNKQQFGEINDTVGLPTQANTPKNFGLNTAQVALSVLAPGADGLAENGIRALAPEATDTAIRLGGRVAGNAAVGGGFNTLSGIENGDDPRKLLEDAAEGAAIGGAGGALFGGVPLLRKLGTGRASADVLPTELEQGAETATDLGGASAANEIADGVRSPGTAEPNGPAAPQTVAPHEISTGAPEVNTPTTPTVTVAAPDSPVPRTTTPPVDTPAVTIPSLPTTSVAPTELEQAANDTTVPAYQRTALKAQLADQAAADEEAQAKALGAGPTGTDRPTFLHKQDMQTIINAGQEDLDNFLNENPNASLQDVEQAREAINKNISDNLQKLQDARSGGSPEAASPAPTNDIAPEPVAPAPVDAAAAVSQGQPLTTPVPDAQGNPIVPNTQQAAIAAEDAGVNPNLGNTTATPSLAPQVETAPRVRTAITKQIGDVAKSLPGSGKLRDVANLDDLKNQAASQIANVSDPEILKAFGSGELDAIPNNLNGIATIRAGVDRLTKMAQNDPENDDIADALNNALDAISSRSSGAGQIQRFVQEDFDAMPLPMKVRYIARNIDKANADVPGYQSLAEDPAKAKVINQQITNFLNDGEEISSRIAANQGKLNQVADDAKAGKSSSENINSLRKSVISDQRALRANNGKLVDFYQQQLPKRALGNRVNDFARNMMLGSFTGRLNDILTTSANIAHQGLQNITQGIIAKAVNLVKPGTALDTLRGSRQFVQGTAEGVQNGVNEFKGVPEAGDLQKSLKNNTEIRTGVQKARGAIVSKIQAATEFATHASEGVQSQRVYQLAVQEGQKAGLSGDLLKQYAEARAANPTKEMLNAGEQLHAQVNNLNDNPISRGLHNVAQSLDTEIKSTDNNAVKLGKTLAGTLRNQVIPFTSWLGGNIWNSITDKNVVAAGLKTLAAAGRGDVDGVVENLAKTVNTGAQAYALGYFLTQHGLITNQGPPDSTGKSYNDAGAYLHIGDRYIPVAFTGFFAPSIILGNAAYQGVQNGGGNPAKVVADTVGKSLSNDLISTGASQLGADNNAARSLSLATQGNPSGAAAQLTGNAAGQFVPAATGDVNAVLNNGTSLNPTHEAADTNVKKINPATGRENKDYVGSAEASLQNKIPVLSQKLPRKAGVAAPDLLDRTTRGTRDTNGSKQVQADALVKTNQAALDKKGNIPNPDDPKFSSAVEARIENGNYDQAITGLSQQIATQKKDPNTPKSTWQKTQQKVDQLKVAKSYGITYDDMKLYNSTSLSDWRDMGDPTSDSYDPATYKKLYGLDQALASKGVAGAFGIGDATIKTSNKQKFSAKTSKGGGSGGSSSEKSNTIGSTPNLGTIDLSDFTPEKITNTTLPTVAPVQPGQLIKKRAISVSSPSY